MAKASIKFAHPESEGRGCALSFEFHYQTDESPAFVRLQFARQKGDGFDDENAFSCDLVLEPLMKFLSVLRGDESVMNEGTPIEVSRGVRFASRSAADGRVAVAVKASGIVGTDEYNILLTKYERLALKTALESSMFFFAFVKGITQ